jgi:hypothetical protein
MTISTQRLHQWGRAFYLIAIGANEDNEISAAFSALAFSGIAFMICSRK